MTTYLDPAKGKSLLFWMNLLGTQLVENASTLGELWQAHVPILLYHMRNLRDPSREKHTASSPLASYQDTYNFLKESVDPDQQFFVDCLNVAKAADGDGFEISKFIVVLLNELRVSSPNSIGQSIAVLEQSGLHEPIIEIFNYLEADDAWQCGKWWACLVDPARRASLAPHLLDAPALPATPARNTMLAGGFATPRGPPGSRRRGADPCFTAPHRINNAEQKNSPLSEMTKQCKLERRRVSMYCGSRDMNKELELNTAISVWSPSSTSTLSRPGSSYRAINSPSIRERRKERELRELQKKYTAATEDLDARTHELRDAQEAIEKSQYRESKLSEKVRELSSAVALKDGEIARLEETKQAAEKRDRERDRELEAADERAKRAVARADKAESDSYKAAEELAERLLDLEKAKRTARDGEQERIAIKQALEDAGARQLRLEQQLAETARRLEEMERECEEIKADCRRKLEDKQTDVDLHMQQLMDTRAENNKKVMDLEEALSALRESTGSELERLIKETTLMEQQMRDTKEAHAKQLCCLREEVRLKEKLGVEREAALKEERAAAEAQERQRTEELAEARARLAELELHIVDRDRRVAAEKQRAADALHKAAEETARKMAAEADRRNKLEGEVEQWRAQLASQSVEEVQAMLAKLQLSEAGWRKEQEEREKERSEWEQRMEQAEQQMAAIRDEKYDEFLENERLRREVAEMKATLDKDRHRMGQQIEELTGELSSARAVVSETERELEEKKAERDELELHTRAEMAALRADYACVRREMAVLERAANETRRGLTGEEEWKDKLARETRAKMFYEESLREEVKMHGVKLERIEAARVAAEAERARLEESLAARAAAATAQEEQWRKAYDKLVQENNALLEKDRRQQHEIVAAMVALDSAERDVQVVNELRNELAEEIDSRKAAEALVRQERAEKGALGERLREAEEAREQAETLLHEERNRAVEGRGGRQREDMDNTIRGALNFDDSVSIGRVSLGFHRSPAAAASAFDMTLHDGIDDMGVDYESMDMLESRTIGGGFQVHEAKQIKDEPLLSQLSRPTSSSSAVHSIKEEEAEEEMETQHTLENVPITGFDCSMQQILQEFENKKNITTPKAEPHVSSRPRIDDLNRRNQGLPPHLQCSYAAEVQNYSPQFSYDDLKKPGGLEKVDKPKMSMKKRVSSAFLRKPSSSSMDKSKTAAAASKSATVLRAHNK